MREYSVKEGIITPMAPKVTAKRSKLMTTRVKAAAQQHFHDSEFTAKQIFSKIKRLKGEKLHWKVVEDSLVHIARYVGQYQTVRPVITSMRHGVYALTSYVKKKNLLDKPMIHKFVHDFIMAKVREHTYVTKHILVEDFEAVDPKFYTALITDNNPEGALLSHDQQVSLYLIHNFLPPD